MITVDNHMDLKQDRMGVVHISGGQLTQEIPLVFWYQCKSVVGGKTASHDKLARPEVDVSLEYPTCLWCIAGREGIR